MFGFGKKNPKDAASAGAKEPAGAKVSTKLCTEKFNGKYPHVGLYDCRERKVWVCKPLDGQAIRTSHAALITGTNDATGTVWKDRFICFWFYTPGTGSGLVLGYPIEWDEAHLLIRIDPQWDYDRQRIIAAELSDHIEHNRERQLKHGEAIISFFRASKLKYAFSAHFVAQTAADSLFYFKRFDVEH
jgi:hypothetical protein